MIEYSVSEDDVTRFFDTIAPLLDERQVRLVTGAFSQMLGRGGVAAVERASGVARSTISRGVSQLESGVEETDRVRAAGAGRKPVEVSQPGLTEALDGLVEPESRGDPMTALRWTSKSTRHLAKELTDLGYRVSHMTVRQLLLGMDYSLQGTAKMLEGADHPDRDAQFRYIADQVAAFQAAGQPVISCDTKKKEQVGRYANGGREWHPKGQPPAVKDHDFPDPDKPKAVPYGVYDLAANAGWVSVGMSADTAAFAVSSIGTWWQKMGSAAYPHARKLLITVDAGGSNGYRNRLWKKELTEFARRAGLEITVCHFPPGTSKWNKIEHRMFSQITLNWRGRPLESYQTVVKLIGSTTTSKGLKVNSELDDSVYHKGVKVTNKELRQLHLRRHDFHGDWNYTVGADENTN